MATLAVLAGCGYVAYAASTDPADGYRLASASTGDVEQTLSLTGTVAPNGRADLSFGTSGTVASVVEEGTTVKKGQVLAMLDTSSLKKSLKTAKASLASAKAQLESDKEAQASGSTSSSSSSTATESSTTTSDSSGGVIAAVFTGTTGTVTAVSDSDVVTQIKALQTEVTDAQTSVSTAEGELEDAQTDLSAAIDKLSALVSGGGTLDDGGALAQALNDAKASCTSTDEGSSERCTGNLDDALAAQGSAKGSVQDAIGQLSSAQEAVGRAKEALSGAKGTLSTAIDDLDALLASASAGGSSGGGTGGGTGGTPEGGGKPGGSPGGSGGEMPEGAGGGSIEGQSGAGTQPEGMTGQGSAESGSGGAVGGAGQSVTAATIAQDQAEIDRAKVDVIDAKAALAAAVIKAPAAGTVAAVDVTEGSSVSAGAAAVTVIAAGLTSVELEVTSAQLSKLQAGQTATVSPAGADKDLPGKVTLLGKVPDTSSGSSTFSVTVTLDEEGLDLLAGNTATVEVVLGSAEDVLTVPASAVSDGTVTVLDKDGNPQRVRVTTGLTGRTTVEVTEGIDAGDEIVLADLSTALPTTDDSSDGGDGAFTNVGGSGGFPGGGGGGFPAGGPPSR
ncbi:HlyD family efflux transporter periplasmic adaptor subunit [Nocardioides luteus]|uniref:HlyD family efflux transporter periplasmic adaptor subunit n=1 Tax=Nocardioides luteus TaxID=1844 RepID=UPI0018CA2615|nr:HlyD family efflux transporter periplasmic adaptor subunit [Nocardioides luteus]MBG6097435.1 multidrug efflux pump subunit AcrA (membrane-fusion protein) [Nocardioides luteus]